MTRDDFQSIAIVPAAGHSRRMGQAKLVLPFQGSTIIEQVIGAWEKSDVDHVVAVVRQNDTELAERCRSAGAAVVLPEIDPAEMRYSVEAGLEFAVGRYRPRSVDAWFLAPADVPRISIALINQLLVAYRRAGPAIFLPSYDGHRGHPVVFPWKLAAEVPQLGPDEGLNSLVKRHQVSEIHWSAPLEWEDVDTPDQYRRLE